MWLQPYKDPTLAELLAHAQISGGGGVNSALLRQPPNQWLDALKQIAPEIKDYIQKKKSDEIANMYLNQVQSPFAGQGADAVKYQQLYQQNQMDQPDTATDDLNYLKLWQQTHPDEYPDAQNQAMTAFQREQTRLREMDIARKQAKDVGARPPNVPQSVFENSQAHNFDPAQAFRDMQQKFQTADVPTITTQEERDALPSGAVYIGPDGKKHRKP